MILTLLFSDDKHILASAIVQILGISIHNLSIDEAVDVIRQRLDNRIITNVCFVNANCCNVARRDLNYQNILNDAELVLPDGIGLQLAGQILNQFRISNSNGTDLFPHLCAALSGTGKRLYLLGGRIGVAERLKQWLETNFPTVKVCGFHHGYFPFAENARVVAAIRAAKPDLLIVAMGVPYQEKWLATYGKTTGASVFMGVGGLFDFYSGRIPRAPHWMRQRGMEWIYRLFQEPRRLWRRYLIGNLAFLFRVLWTVIISSKFLKQPDSNRWN